MDVQDIKEDLIQQDFKVREVQMTSQRGPARKVELYLLKLLLTETAIFEVTRSAGMRVAMEKFGKRQGAHNISGVNATGTHSPFAT